MVLLNVGIIGISNLYIPVCDNWIIIDNTGAVSEMVAQGGVSMGKAIKKDDMWSIIVSQSAINE